MSKNIRKFVVSAGSSYGSKVCVYHLIDGKLVLWDKGELSNLTNNSKAANFEGLTLEESKQKIQDLNSQPVGHEPDGCHLCGWSIAIKEL